MRGTLRFVNEDLPRAYLEQLVTSLRDAGLVSDRRQGRWVYYSLRPEVLAGMTAFLEERRSAEGAPGVCGCGESHGGSCCG